MSKPAKKRVRARGRGTVAILALLFISSAGFRIATSATEVLAEARSVLEPNTSEAALAKPDHAAGPTDAHLAELLKDFKEREETIRQKELDLEKRMIALQAAETRVNDQIEKMDAAERKLRDTLALASTAAEDDLARLTTVYENMKPKTAAALFEEMDAGFAAGFIARMRPDAAASVLAGMTPQSAYSISTILAGRNADVPTE